MRESLKILSWVGFALLARLMPHPPNLTPYASLIMLMGCQLSGRMSALMALITLIISDIFLAIFFHYPVFGSWSFFTYSGFIVMAFASHCLQGHRTVLRIGGFALSSVMLYWLWTNFGTWWLAGIYPHSAAGLMACLVAGLPFLQMSLLSAFIFVPLFFGLILLMEKKCLLKVR